MTDQREILTWEGFGNASRDLATSIAKSGYEPDMILAIARGGLFLAGALGYALSVKNTYTMNVEFYTDVDKRLDITPSGWSRNSAPVGWRSREWRPSTRSLTPW